MLYDNIIIDSANLFYRLQREKDTVIDITKKFISFVNDDAKRYLKKDGTIYIVFDPISKSTLNEEKSFHVQSYSTRKNINKKYKAKRTYSNLYANTIENIWKFFAYRGESIKEVYAQEYEADDFIEPLVSSLSGDIALVTTDEDWAKALNEHVFMINRGFDNPWSKQEFYDKFKFNPTPAANILYKSFFGDSSDNIQGCIFLKKAKFMTNIRKTCYNVICDVSNRGITIDEFLKEFDSLDYIQISKKEEKSDLEILAIEFSIASQKENVVGKMKQNIQLIRSLLEGKDVSQFIHFNKENQKFNDMIRQAIYGLDATSWFGKVHAK